LVEILEGTRPQGRSRYRKKYNIKKYIKMCGRGLDSSGLGLNSVADSCEHDNEHLGYIKGGEFLENQISKKYSVKQENLNKRDHCKDLGVDGGIMLKLILKK
jgi:hypothetical protein